MKKQSVLGLVLTVALLSACGGNTENKATTTATEEVNAAENSGAEETQKETETEKSDNAATFAEQNGIRFGKPSPLSMDYGLIFVDKETYTEADSADFHVIEKGLADYNFYSIRTWPADKEGYTTAKISYSCDFSNESHAPEDWGSVSSFFSTRDLKLFDYYTGDSISLQEPVALAGQTTKTDVIDTKIEYDNNNWNISAWQEFFYNRFRSINKYTDATHYDYSDDFSSVTSIYVTYPDEYDGLSFGIQVNGEYEVTPEKIKESGIVSATNENTGKDILTIFEESGASKDDILFCTMKDPESIYEDKVASAEEATIPFYEEREGLTNYNDSSEAECFNLPLKFYIFDDNGELLGEDKAKADKQEVTYAVKDVTITGNGQGVTTVGFTYTANQDLTVDMMDYEGDFSGYPILPDIDVYNIYTGESVGINTEVQDNSDFGEWVDDTHISYKVDYTCNVEFELTEEKERPEDIAIVFGNRKSTSGDSVRFKLPYLI